jgi:flotillin
MGGSMVWIGALVLLSVVVFFTFVLLLVNRYKRCPSNMVLVIYGKVAGGTSAKCIHGGAAFIWPLLQDSAYLSLEPIQIEVPLKDALSIENIRVNVPSVFTVAVGTEYDVMQNAAIRLLGLSLPEVKKQAEDIIFGQLRQVIASMSIQEINRDRDIFLHNIQNSLEPELQKIGLVLINVNITDITDDSGYIEAIGKKAASQAVQQARGDVAEQEKIGEVRVAEAERDKLVQVKLREQERRVQVATAEAEAIRGEKMADRDQRVSIANAEAEAIKGEKTADRDQRVNIASANAEAVKGENDSRAAIADSEAHLKVKQAEAYQVGETRKRVAEAAVLEAQNRAMAKTALADAERIEAERRAAVEAPAKAEKARTIVEAEAEAERRRIEAEGEAKAIFARFEAEARGNYEVLAKKGQGLREIISACGGAQEAFQLLMLEHLDTLAQTSAQAISNIKFDKVVVWEGGNGNGKSSTASFLQNMAHSLPPMLQVMRDIAGVELPETLLKMQAEVEKTAAPAETSPPPAV